MQITDLVLLVGTNPLPNYVVADYFLKKQHNLKIWFVFTTQTKKIKQNIQAVLQNNHPNIPDESFADLYLKDPWNPESIQNELSKAINATDNLKNAHLNYTGGTKAMSAVAYSVMKEFGSNLSYLSARDYKIVFDNGVKSESLLEQIKISFNDLIELHGYNICGSIHQSIHEDAINYMRELIEAEKYTELKEGKGSYNRKNYFANKDGDCASLPKQRSSVVKEDKKKALSDDCWENLKAFKPNEYFKTLANKFGEDFFLDGNFNQKIRSEIFSQVVKFIDGQWLEEYVYTQLKSHQELFDEIEMSQEIKQPSWDDQLKFELDVVLLKGYQLVGISCTTDSSKSRCKQKAFEIIHRTRQIGGDEARPILVCALKNEGQDKVKPNESKEALQKEMDIEMGSKNSILILGIEDWKIDRLIPQIKEYLGVNS